MRDSGTVSAMASKTFVVLEDDIDGSEGAETVTFALDGVTYEIDLSDKNAAKLRKALGTYTGAGRRIRRTTATTAHTVNSATGVDNTAVRAWAASNKIHVNARGRIPTQVIEQYREAGH